MLRDTDQGHRIQSGGNSTATRAVSQRRERIYFRPYYSLVSVRVARPAVFEVVDAWSILQDRHGVWLRPVGLQEMRQRI